MTEYNKDLDIAVRKLKRLKPIIICPRGDLFEKIMAELPDIPVLVLERDKKKAVKEYLKSQKLKNKVVNIDELEWAEAENKPYVRGNW